MTYLLDQIQDEMAKLLKTTPLNVEVIRNTDNFTVDIIWCGLDKDGKFWRILVGVNEEGVRYWFSRGESCVMYMQTSLDNNSIREETNDLTALGRGRIEVIAKSMLGQHNLYHF